MKTRKISTLKTKKNFQKKLSYVDLLLEEEKDVVCSYCCESLWVDNKCSKHFKSYLGKYAIYNFY